MECDLFPSGRCYYDGSSLQGEELGERFMTEGEEVVWAELKERYRGWLLGEDDEVSAEHKPHSELFEEMRFYIDRALKADIPLPAYALAMETLQRIEEQLEAQDRLLMRAAELLHNSTPPRDAGWHDRFDLWLADNRSHPASSPASVPKYPAFENREELPKVRGVPIDVPDPATGAGDPR